MDLNLISIVKKRFIDAIRDVQPPNKWKVLIVDAPTVALINNVTKLYDLLEENVTVVEHIENRRNASQTFEAVYLLSPEPWVIDAVISDFARAQPKYAAAHLFFTSALDDRLLDKLTQSPAGPRLKTVKELFVDFYPSEAQTFTLRDSRSFLKLYNPECKSLVDRELQRLAGKLVAVCATMGEFPVIRYQKHQNPTHPAHTLSERLAKSLQQQLDGYARTNPDFPPPSPRPRGVFFVFDRSLDPYAPLLHEFTYQAMAQDLLPIQEGKKYVYEIKGTTGEMEEKEAEFSEEDTVWTSVRHMHMREAIDNLMSSFNKFVTENTNFTDSEKATSLNDMRDMLASLPEFQEMRDRFSLHLSMAEECMNLFQKHKLPEVGLLEQAASTGLNSEGKVPKEFAEALVPILDDPAVGVADRLRLIMLYLVFRDGLFESDRAKMIQHAGLGKRDREALENLGLLGIRVSRTLKDKPSRPKPNKKRPADEEEPYELSRYVPVLKSVLDEHIKGTLDPVAFPYINNIPGPEAMAAAPAGAVAQQPQGSLRSARPTWAKAKTQAGGYVEPRQRVLVFIAGGATYSEARSVYELSAKHNRDVILGSTEMLSPAQWLNQLSCGRLPRERCGLDEDQPPKQCPGHLLEPDPPANMPPPQVPAQKPMSAPPGVGGLVKGHKPSPSVSSVNNGKDGKEKKKKKFGLF
ncbi:syntaxin binding protein 1 [Saitoella coloradoensis]